MNKRFEQKKNFLNLRVTGVGEGIKRASAQCKLSIGLGNDGTLLKL